MTETENHALRQSLSALVSEGRARLPRRDISELPVAEPGPDVSAALADMRDDHRW